MSKACKGAVSHYASREDDLLRAAGRKFLAGTLSVALSALPCSIGVAHAGEQSRIEPVALAGARGVNKGSSTEGQGRSTAVQGQGKNSAADAKQQAPSAGGSTENKCPECEVFLEAWAGSIQIHDKAVLSQAQGLEVRVWGSGIKMQDALPTEAQAKLNDESGEEHTSFERDWKMLEGFDEPVFCLRATDELMDGSYILTVDVQDVLGHTHSTAWNVTVDTTAPMVSVDELGVPAATLGDRACYDEARTIGIRVTDANLDTQKTMVNGTRLCDLLESAEGEEGSQGVRYEPWTTSKNEDRTTTFASTATFSDGIYELPVVRAVDLAGNESCDLHESSSFVVDTKAPVVTATVSTSPSFVCDKGSDGAQLAFFNAPTTVELRFDDLSGVSSVECEGATSSFHMDVWPNKDGATIQLAADPLASTTSIVVTDACKNSAVWSLGEEGESRTKAGVSAVPNDPIRVRATGELVSKSGHPALLFEDLTPPMLNIAGVEEGAFLRGEQHLCIEAYDQSLGYVATHDPNQQVACVLKDNVCVTTQTVGYSGAREGDVSHVYDLRIGADATTHENDGRYEVRVGMTDMAQNAASEQVRTFTIDTTPPALRVVFEDEQYSAKDDGRCYDGPRTAHVFVADKNLCAQKLNEGRLVRVVPEGKDGCTSADVLVGSWKAGLLPDEYCCDVEFPRDGTYSLRISGADEAGNLLVGAEGTEVSEGGIYDSGEFAVDTTQPSVSVAYAEGAASPHAFAGMDYFCKPVFVRVTVVDRNLDASRTTVTDSKGNEFVPEWSASERAADGNVTHTAIVAYSQRSGHDGGRMTPEVHAQDLAVNKTSHAGKQFVVDQEAPYLSRVLMSKDPSAQAREGWGADPIWFYNQRDGSPVTMTFEFGDEYLIDQAWVEDPRGFYDVVFSEVHGKAFCTVSLALRNHDAEGAERDAVWSRDVRLWVRDMAGNTRWWSLSPTGAIVADHAGDATNVSLGNAGVYPLALIADASAPQVSVDGVEDGGMYNDSRTARVEVREHGFDYLRRYDPNRTVVSLQREESRDGSEVSKWTVAARQFEQEGDSQVFEQLFDSDGHYSLHVGFADYAGNPSNEVSIKEFVVDKTAPAISVSWDNNDAQNGRYFKAYRTATVTVVEHNFDASLINVATTGTSGEWVSAGDTHTLTVSFSADAAMSDPHKLRIGGRDRAGNEAVEYVEPDFAVDTKAPTVEVKKRVGEPDQQMLGAQESELEDKSAFADGMMPIVELADEASFDASSVEVELRGKRDGSAEPSFLVRNTSMLGPNAMRVDWGNIGLVEDGDEARYLLDADDVYTVTARVRDMAGNTSEQKVVSFSLNRFGSNFFFESTDGLVQDEDGSWSNEPLPQAPCIVVHEVNVSGVPEQGPYSGENARMVTKEYANATKRLVRTESAESSGYVVQASAEPNARNPYEGWWEYTYTVSPGNFGKGSDSDYGDGGQGLYRVDVSSHDKASNNNTTSAYWGSGALRTERGKASDKQEQSPKSKSATVSFTLDEFGPKVEDVNLPEPLKVGNAYWASFRVVDRITRGDRISVTVDGQEVAVYREGSPDQLDPQEVVGEGVYTFEIVPKPAFAHRRAQIRVWDYTDLQSRAQTVDREGFAVTTLVVEAVLAMVAAGAIGGVSALLVRRRSIAEPSVPHGK